MGALKELFTSGFIDEETGFCADGFRREPKKALSENGRLTENLKEAFARRGFPEKYAAGETTPVSEKGDKVPKVKANYRSAFGAARCGACAHLRGKSCELVEGEVEPNDVCDLYAPERPDLTAAATEGYARELEKYGLPSENVSPE